MVKAAIFDMDGLLIDSEPLWWQAQINALATVNVKPQQSDYKHIIGTGLESTLEYWHHKHPWTGQSLKDVEALILDDFIDMFKKQGALRPGVQRTLNLFKAKAIPMAIASSTFYEVINMVVDTLKIRQYFGVIYSAEREPHSKPHPGVFISTAALLKVEPRSCLVFEDAPAGVLAAKAAKMRCIAVPELHTKDHPFIQVADIVIDSLEEFNEAMLERFA